MPNSFSLKAQIKAEALRLGFSACGIASVAPVKEEAWKHFAQWLKNGYHADMHYLERYTDLRRDPSFLLEGAQSVICLALSYYPPQLQKENTYQLAWYAYGKDYHEVVKSKLHQLLQFICTLHPNTQGRICVDTAPLLEKYWAEQAGIGWIGKHTQLILPQKGAAFVLGEVLINFELPPDTPQENRCGSCKRCIEACPAQALIESTQPNSQENACGYGQSFLDARRCLSYQTIENRNATLSTQTIEALGERIYGCDACQIACPHTRYANAEETPAEFHPSAELMALEKEDWQTLHIETYRRLFKGSAVKRAKYEGLLRNIQAVKTKPSTKK